METRPRGCAVRSVPRHSRILMYVNFLDMGKRH